MFDLPGLNTVREVVVNEEAVGPIGKPLMIHADPEAKKGVASAR